MRIRSWTLVVVIGLLMILSNGVLAKQTVSFMTLDVVNFRPMLEKFIAEFEKANPDVDIVPIFTSQLEQQALTSLQSGDEPDIIFIYSNAIIPYIQQGRFSAIPESFEKKIKDSVYPYTLPALSSKGKLYGVPYNFFPSFSMIMYNIDLWKESGVDPTSAKSWNQFMQMTQKVTKRDASGRIVQAGFSAERDSENYFLAWVLQMGGKPFNKDGSPAFDNKLGRNAIQLYADIYRKWKVDDAEFGLTAEEFKKGRVAATVMGPWYGSIVSKDTPNIKFAYFKQPKISEDASLKWPLFQIWTHVVSKKSQKKDGVWRFLEYLMQPGNCARWSAFSGEMSTVIKAQDYPEVKKCNYLAPFAQVADYGVAEDLTQWLSTDVRVALRTMVRSVAYGQATIDQAMSTAVREISRITRHMVK